MTKITSVEKEIEYLRFAMREGCNCKGCEDDRANIGEHCVIRQALTADRLALLTELREWADSRIKPQEHGPDCLGEFCDSAFCNWEDIYKTNTEIALLKAHLYELIKSNSV